MQLGAGGPLQPPNLLPPIPHISSSSSTAAQYHESARAQPVEFCSNANCANAAVFEGQCARCNYVDYMNEKRRLSQLQEPPVQPACSCMGCPLPHHFFDCVLSTNEDRRARAALVRQHGSVEEKAQFLADWVHFSAVNVSAAEISERMVLAAQERAAEEQEEKNQDVRDLQNAVNERHRVWSLRLRAMGPEEQEAHNLRFGPPVGVVGNPPSYEQSNRFDELHHENGAEPVGPNRIERDNELVARRLAELRAREERVRVRVAELRLAEMQARELEPIPEELEDVIDPNLGNANQQYYHEMYALHDIGAFQYEVVFNPDVPLAPPIDMGLVQSLQRGFGYVDWYRAINGGEEERHGWLRPRVAPVIREADLVAARGRLGHVPINLDNDEIPFDYQVRPPEPPPPGPPLRPRAPGDGPGNGIIEYRDRRMLMTEFKTYKFDYLDFIGKWNPDRVSSDYFVNHLGVHFNEREVEVSLPASLVDEMANWWTFRLREAPVKTGFREGVYQLWMVLTGGVPGVVVGGGLGYYFGITVGSGLGVACATGALLGALAQYWRSLHVTTSDLPPNYVLSVTKCKTLCAELDITAEQQRHANIYAPAIAFQRSWDEQQNVARVVMGAHFDLRRRTWPKLKASWGTTTGKVIYGTVGVAALLAVAGCFYLKYRRKEPRKLATISRIKVSIGDKWCRIKEVISLVASANFEAELGAFPEQLIPRDYSYISQVSESWDRFRSTWFGRQVFDFSSAIQNLVSSHAGRVGRRARRHLEASPKQSVTLLQRVTDYFLGKRS